VKFAMWHKTEWSLSFILYMRNLQGMLDISALSWIKNVTELVLMTLSETWTDVSIGMVHEFTFTRWQSMVKFKILPVSMICAQVDGIFNAVWVNATVHLWRLWMHKRLELWTQRCFVSTVQTFTGLTRSQQQAIRARMLYVQQLCVLMAVTLLFRLDNVVEIWICAQPAQRKEVFRSSSEARRGPWQSQSMVVRLGLLWLP